MKRYTSPVFPVTVPAGRSLPLSISFAPSDAATDVGRLTIESDAVDEPSLQVTVEATGVDPSQPFLDVLEEPIVFPETAPGSVFHTAVPILNRGGSDLTVELTSEGEGFSVVADDTALTAKGQGQDMRTVSAGASITATVAFAPPSEGEFEGTLTIQSNDPGLPQASIALSGLGVDAPPAPMVNPGGVVNAASFAANAIAPGAILSMFGVNFADTDAVATTAPLPDSLSGTRVEITDSAGMTRSAGLFGIFNAGQQINLFLDPQTAVGAAELTLRRSDGQSSSVPIQIDQVGPGIFFIQNGVGENVALANSLRISGGGATTELTFSTADFSLAPIDLGPESDQVFVSLFLTGIQFASGVQSMSATIDGEPVPVFNFAGDLAQFVGLGQVNIGPIPRSFIGRGPVEINLTIDGAVANPVMVSFL